MPGFPHRGRGPMAMGGNDEPGSTMPISGDAIAAGMHALHRMLLSDSDLDATLGHVASLAAASLPMCDLADVTLIRDEQPITKGATDERARALDAVQFSTGAGPCLDACRTQQPVHVESTRGETRWPQFAAAAVDAGVLSMMAIPLVVRSAVI